jgi:hypothetical protein
MADEKIDSSALASSDAESSQPDSHGAKELAGVTVSEQQSLEGPDSLELERNPFADPDVAAYWATVYEKSSYECRHIFDPALQWTAAEEKKIVRKLDVRVCLWAVSLPTFQR